MVLSSSHLSPPILKRRRSSSSSSSTTTTTSSAIMNNQNKNTSTVIEATTCSHCGTTTTPLWRRAPNGDTICNACGLYLKTKHTMRPLTNGLSKNNNSNNSSNNNNSNNSGSSCSSKKTSTGGGSCSGAGQCNGLGGSAACAGCPTFNNQQLRKQQQQQQVSTMDVEDMMTEGLICANCRTTTTPLWRRDDKGNTICNACGLYFKLHKVHRPVSMKRNIIKRRKRLIVVEPAVEIKKEGQDENISDQQQPMAIDEEENDQHHQTNNNSKNETSPIPSLQLSPSSSPLSTSNSSPSHDPISISLSPTPKQPQKDIHSQDIPPIEDYITSSRFPSRQQQQIPLIPFHHQKSSTSPTLPPLPTSFPQRLSSNSSFSSSNTNTLPHSSLSNSRISLPPIHSLSTPPSPPLSISSLLSNSTPPQQQQQRHPSPIPSSSSSTEPIHSNLNHLINRLNGLNNKLSSSPHHHHHHLSHFVYQLDQLITQAEASIEKE